MSFFRSLRNADELLEELLAWLAKLEKTLVALESEPLPDDIPTIRQLIEEHKYDPRDIYMVTHLLTSIIFIIIVSIFVFFDRDFMENTQVRQGEVDSVCKSRQVQAATKDKKTSRPKTPSLVFFLIYLL